MQHLPTNTDPSTNTNPTNAVIGVSLMLRPVLIPRPILMLLLVLMPMRSESKTIHLQVNLKDSTGQQKVLQPLALLFCVTTSLVLCDYLAWRPSCWGVFLIVLLVLVPLIVLLVMVPLIVLRTLVRPASHCAAYFGTSCLSLAAYTDQGVNRGQRCPVE